MRFPIRWFIFLMLNLSSGLAAGETMLVFGDSLSAAYGIPRERGWVALLQQTRLELHVINASISGETSGGGLHRLPDALHRYRPDIVIIELGANDGLRGTDLAAIENNLSELIRMSQHAHAKVVLLGMQLPPNYGAQYTAAFRQLYPRLAKRYHATLVPFMLEGVPLGQFQADALHPTAAAQMRILENVMRGLAELR